MVRADTQLTKEVHDILWPYLKAKGFKFTAAWNLRYDLPSLEYSYYYRDEDGKVDDVLRLNVYFSKTSILDVTVDLYKPRRTSNTPKRAGIICKDGEQFEKIVDPYFKVVKGELKADDVLLAIQKWVESS